MLYIGNEKDASNKQESPKNRSDLSVSIYEQLTLPLRDGRTTTLDVGASGSSTLPDLTPGSDPSLEINVSVTIRCKSMTHYCLFKY